MQYNMKDILFCFSMQISQITEKDWENIFLLAHILPVKIKYKILNKKFYFGFLSTHKPLSTLILQAISYVCNCDLNEKSVNLQ